MVVNGRQVDLSYNSGTIRPIKRINLSDKIFFEIIELYKLRGHNVLAYRGSVDDQ